jgi:hypothetical protein
VHEVTYRGNATVDGHGTLVFSLRPTTGPRNVTVWLERRHFLPVKLRRVVGDGSERLVTTVRHVDLRFDPGFGDEAFAVSPPNETAVVDNDGESPRVESFESVVAANESAPLRVPDPDPPAPSALAARRSFTARPVRR